jgi:hypothetical protein
MGHYQEEAAAMKDLQKVYLRLKEIGMEDEEEALNKLYLEINLQYGRGKLWCDKKLARLKAKGAE